MQSYRIPIWKSSPFCRLIVPVIAGIQLQWQLQFSLWVLILFTCCFCAAFFLFYLLPLGFKFRLQSLQGLLLIFIVSGFAMFISWQKDIRKHPDWYGRKLADNCALIIRIDEPVTEKAKSYKVTGYVETVISGTKIIPVKGKLFVYLSKDSSAGLLRYGDRIIINKPLQRIKNSGNPGAFNYERYAALQQAFHTVYLKTNEWILLKATHVNRFNKFIFSLQSAVISILRKYISGDKNVSGIAEALLIGYKEDLDKDLVQAYSNAGVVHIIAISGMHLGLIYVMLVWLFSRIPWIKNQVLIKVALILSCLWIFSLLTGASASVLRSAVMFTCIITGKNFFKQSAIYNSLGASAFILLCYDPCFLWDVGFQLSYFAVIGIVWLQKPIIGLFYFPYKMVNKIWSMFAITLAAQVVTFPVCLYYFHQFPNLFFITNLLAVPLSTIILFAEIFLIVFSGVPYINIFAGKVTGSLVWLMNAIIEACNNVPYSLLDNIYATVTTTCLLYGFVICASTWMITKSRYYRILALLFFVFFSGMQAFQKVTIFHQKKIVIYNVPQRQAIDFICRDKYFFYGDSSMLADGMLRNFHLKPARIALQAKQQSLNLENLFHDGHIWQFFGRRLIIIDSNVHFVPQTKKVFTDILLISNNPQTTIAALTTAIKPAVVVFGSSNSLWKIEGWKKECLALALPCFSIPEQGAFILDIE